MQPSDSSPSKIFPSATSRHPSHNYAAFHIYNVIAYQQPYASFRSPSRPCTVQLSIQYIQNLNELCVVISHIRVVAMHVQQKVYTLGFQLRGTARRRDVGAPALSTPMLMTSFVLGVDVKATVLSGTEG